MTSYSAAMQTYQTIIDLHIVLMIDIKWQTWNHKTIFQYIQAAMSHLFIRFPQGVLSLHCFSFSSVAFFYCLIQINNHTLLVQPIFTNHHFPHGAQQVVTLSPLTLDWSEELLPKTIFFTLNDTIYLNWILGRNHNKPQDKADGHKTLSFLQPMRRKLFGHDFIQSKSVPVSYYPNTCMHIK